MAPTLFSPRHDETQQTSFAVKVPNVFVVPPEEDESPAWCYFNAADGPLRTSDPNFPFLDNPLTELHAKSLALYDSAGPFGSHNATILSVLDQPSTFDVRHRGDDAIEVEDNSGPYRRNTPNEGNTSVGNDSDVVEVVKVRRQTLDEQKYIRPASPPPIKRSKSFKIRASKVFRSMKIVGKGSNRNKHSVPDIPPLPPIPKEQTARNNPEEDLPPRSKTPIVSRRRSTILSQLFSPSISSVDISHNTPEIPEQSSIPLSISTSPFSPNMTPRPPSPLHDLLDPSPSGSSDPEAEYRGIRSTSPSPSTRTFSGKRRFSVLGLQRLFSFSSESTDSYPLHMSRDSSGPSTVSSLGPDTPTEERAPLPPLPPSPFQLQLDLEGAGKPLDMLPSISTPGVHPGDISYEMRLDSLHFDALSFDMDRF